MNDIYRGDNKSYTLAFTDAAGDPIDITGWKMYFTMKRNPNHSDDQAPIRVDVTAHDDPANGLTSFNLTNAQTYLLMPGTYYYDIQVKKAENDILTIVSGEIIVLADITRRED